ncbi:MAG: chorismate-binding protein, partial [Hyphomicrobiales bacterium]|nr:chorismate-binding protein [Hyphomicrobiales bacterium]
MRIEPDRDAFRSTYERGAAQVVWTRLVADLETPVSALMKVAAGRRNCFLLESVEGGAVRGRYSIIGADPDLLFRATGDKAELNRQPASDPEAFEPLPEPSLTALRSLIEQSTIAMPEDLPPMAAGIFGYLGYDMVRQMEELDPAKPDPIGTPDAMLMRPTVILVFDAIKDEITVVTPVRPSEDNPAENAYARAIDRITEIVDALDRPLAKSADPAESGIGAITSNTSPDEYRAMVARAKDYIGAGDIFQVVLSQRFETPFALPP